MRSPQGAQALCSVKNPEPRSRYAYAIFIYMLNLLVFFKLSIKYWKPFRSLSFIVFFFFRKPFLNLFLISAEKCNKFWLLNCVEGFGKFFLNPGPKSFLISLWQCFFQILFFNVDFLKIKSDEFIVASCFTILIVLNVLAI